MGMRACPLCSSDIAGRNAAEVDWEYKSMVRKAQAAEAMSHAVDRAVSSLEWIAYPGSPSELEKRKPYDYDDVDNGEIYGLIRDVERMRESVADTWDELSAALSAQRDAFRDDGPR